MIRSEFSYLKKHRLMMVVLFIIALIPTIYAVTFLKSMWDPYGQTNKIAVAVVNEDHRATMNATTLTLGKDLATNLTNSDSLDFHVVSAKTARTGIKSGKYYAVYTIPANFSHNATTVFTKHPQQLQLHVTLSSGRNLFAGKIAGTAASSIQRQLDGKLNAAYTKTLVAGLSRVGAGMQQAADGANKLANGGTTLTSGMQQFQNGLTTATNGQRTLAQSASKLASGTQQYTTGVDSAATGSTTLANGLSQVNSKLPALTNGLTAMHTGTTHLASGLSQSVNGSAALAQGATRLNTGLSELTQSSATLTTKSKEFSAQLAAFATQIQKSSNAGNTSLTNLAELIRATQSALNATVSAQQQTATAASTAVATAADGMNLTAAQKETLQKAVTDTYIKSAVTQQTSLKPLLTQLQTALTQLQTTATAQATTTTQLTGALTKLTGGATQLATGNAKLSTAAQALTTGSHQVATGAAQLNEGTTKLAAGATTLNHRLGTALPQTDALTHGVTQLTTGANTLTSGLTTLAGKGAMLASGSNQLATGATTLAAGGDQLNAATGQLNTGTQRITTGSKQLASKLHQGSTELPQLHYTKATAKMIASPVKTTSHDRDNVPNNGSAMMPYMGTVSLFVCAMAVNMMFDTVTPRKRPKNGRGWWASKSAILNLVAILAATIEYGALVGLAGLRPVNGFATWLLLILASLTFMNIVTWLNLALSRAGSFFAMVLLVLQLSSSGGTYPIELSNRFFETLHPLLPMSYVVDGLRHTVMMHDFPMTDVLVLVGFFLAFSGLMLLNYERRYLRTSDAELAALDTISEE